MTNMIDTHCHLTDKRFDSDRDAVIKRAEDSGVGKFICVLSEFDDRSVKVFRNLIRKENIYGAAGIHPHEASGFAESENRLLEILKEDKVVAVGEAGLDYHYMNSPREAQISAFEKQIALSGDRKMPLVVHCREAFEDCFDALKNSSGMRVVIHCFTGSGTELSKWLELGFYISFSGAVTFKNSGELREALKEVPDEKLIIETDSPYLAPQPVRGKRNEPAFIKYTYGMVARERGVTPEEIASIVSKNSAELFGI